MELMRKLEVMEDAPDRLHYLHGDSRRPIEPQEASRSSWKPLRGFKATSEIKLWTALALGVIECF
jgi:hypothetical protein